MATRSKKESHSFDKFPVLSCLRFRLRNRLRRCMEGEAVKGSVGIVGSEQILALDSANPLRFVNRRCIQSTAIVP